MSVFAKNNVQNGTPTAAKQKKEGASFFGIQAKLTVGKPNDKYEKEADSVADKVVAKTQKSDSFFGGESFFPGTPKPIVQRSSFEEVQKREGEEEIQEKPLAEMITPVVQLASDDDEIQEKCTDCETEEQLQRLPFEEVQKKELVGETIQQQEEEETVQQKCDSCEEEESVQRKGASNQQASGSIESRLRSSKGGGSAMSAQTKSSMEAGFGADFSNVRIHTGSNAIGLSKDLGAQAFTHGNDIYFNEGKYNPSSTSGQHLLAHELTHTIQQGGSNAVAQNKIQRWPAWADSAASWVADTASSAASTVADGAIWVGGQVVDGAVWVGDQVAAGAGWVGDQISAAANWVMEQLNSAIDSGKEYLNEKWEKIEEFATSAFDDIKNGFSSLSSFITTPMSFMRMALSTMNADLLSAAWNLLKAGGSGLLAGVNIIINGVLSIGDTLWSTVSDFIDGVFDTIDSLFDNVAFNLLPDSIKRGIRSAFDGLRSLWDRISSFWHNLWSRLTGFIRDILAGINEFVDNVIDFGIQQLISTVRGMKEMYDYIVLAFSDPVGTITPFVEGIAAMINEEGPGRSQEFGEQFTHENYPGEGSQSSNNGVVQREMLDGEERSTATLSEVLEGIVFYVWQAWEDLDILGMLWQTFKEMFWPPETIKALYRIFDNLWNDEWATAADAMYMPRNLLTDPLGCLHDIWSNYLILLDFPLALLRTINNVIGLLMGYITILAVIIGAALGGIAGSAAGGVGAIPGMLEGAKAGLAAMGPVGLALAGSIIQVEATTAGVNMFRLFFANQTCEKRQVDIMQSVASAVTAAVTAIVAILLALLAKLISMIAEFLKGAGRTVPAPAPVVPEPVAPGQPRVPQPVPQGPQAPAPSRPVQPVPQGPQTPAPPTPAQPIPQGPQVPAPAQPTPQPASNVVPFPGQSQPTAPATTPAAPAYDMAAKFEDDSVGEAKAQLALEENEVTTDQTMEDDRGPRDEDPEMVEAGIVQKARIDNINPDACDDDDDDCENIRVPRYAPQDNISRDHQNRTGGVSANLTGEVTSLREVAGFRELSDYYGNNIAGFIYEIYEDDRAQDPIGSGMISRPNDDVHSEERIVAELVALKRTLPRSNVLRVDQIATERSACSNCYSLIRNNRMLTGLKIYTQQSGIYFIVRYNARNRDANARGLRDAYCGSSDS